MTVDAPPAERFTEEWRARYERTQAELADPHGFLAVTGTFWLRAVEAGEQIPFERRAGRG